MNNYPAMADVPDRIVDSKERRHIIPYSDVHVGRLEKAGKFPKRIALGPGRNGWSLRELMEYVEEKKRQRDALAAQAETEIGAASTTSPQDAGEQLVADRAGTPIVAESKPAAADAA